MSPADDFERRVVISGLGRSQTGRRVDRDELELTVDACLAAIADAGLTPADIEGLVTWPGEDMRRPSGFSAPGTATVQQALRLRLQWEGTGGEGFNILGSIVPGAMAVATGYCRHVLCYRTVTEGSARRAKKEAMASTVAERARGTGYWQAPYGRAIMAAWQAQLHFDRYGLRREDLGAVALNGRRNAGLNENACYRDPLTLDDYMSARMISSPLCLFDCDVPSDGSFAAVLSVAEYAHDSPSQALAIEALGAARYDGALWEQRTDGTTMKAHDAAAVMWSRTTLRPEDVDFAQLYDGFSIFVPMWLEALGFCGLGEAKDFMTGGKAIARDGQLPVNTHGGQLSEGRFIGWGFLYEAGQQLRGQAGARQLENANLGVVGVGGGNVGQAMLLRRYGS
jgi:acetyl-CoA acetyltransferase